MEDFPSQTTCPLTWLLLASQAEPNIQARLNAAHNGQPQQIGVIEMSAPGVIPVIELSIKDDVGAEILNIAESPAGFRLAVFSILGRAEQHISYGPGVNSSRSVRAIDLLHGIVLGHVTAPENRQCEDGQIIATAIAVMALTALHVRRIVGQ